MSWIDSYSLANHKIIQDTSRETNTKDRLTMATQTLATELNYLNFVLVKSAIVTITKLELKMVEERCYNPNV